MNIGCFSAKPFYNDNDPLPCFLMPYFPRMKIVRQHIHCFIIRGRSQSTGENNHLCCFAAKVNSFFNLFDIITHSQLAGDLITMLIHECRNPGTIGIDNLANHDFITNRQYRSFHGSNHFIS